jgi:Tol biopolymer transport system component
MRGRWVGVVWLLFACNSSSEERRGVDPDAGNEAADGSPVDAQPAASCIDSTETGVITLSPDLADFHFPEYVVAPDSERVVMVGGAGDNPGDVPRTRMFSTPICGGEATEIGPPAPVDAEVNLLRVRITPDSSRVVYTRSLYTANDGLTVLLHSVPVGGGDIAPLAPQLAGDPDHIIDTFVVGPDGTVVYLTKTEQGAGTRLFSVPADGSAEPQLLAEPTDIDGQIYPTFALTAAGDRVVFAADMTGAGVTRLYSAPTAGGDVTPLTPTASDGTGASRFFHVSGDHVLFTGSLDGPVPNRLYSTSAAGGARTVLGTLDGVFLLMHDVPATDDVVFVGVRGDGIRRVYRATIGTPGIALLSGDAGFDTEQVGIGGYDYSLQLNSDGSRIVYMDDRDTAWAVALYSAPIAGGDVQLISQPNSDWMRGIGPFAAIPGTDQVVFTATIEERDVARLYRVADTGGDIVRLAPEEANSTGSVVNSQPSTDGAWILYLCECIRPGARELFKIRPDGSDRTDVFTDPSGADVWSYDFSPDGRWIIWNAMVPSDGRVRVSTRHL